LLSAIGCSPTSRATERRTEIPTPYVLSMDDGVAEHVGVQRIVVAYKGAKNAPSDVARSREAARQRAQTVATVAQMSGEHFTELVRQYSDHPPLEDGGAGGALLERGNGLLEPEAELAAFRLAVGEVSAPVATKTGFVVVKRTPTPTGGPEQIGARHILIGYQGASRAGPDITRSREEARALAQKILAQARAGQDWHTLWQTHSNEPSKQNDGELGLFGRGQMVPAFERAAFSLEIGEISKDVVETPFGFHVIQRTR
jgi:parvulin-like peptidyl-prolyl isomerase